MHVNLTSLNEMDLNLICHVKNLIADSTKFIKVLKSSSIAVLALHKFAIQSRIFLYKLLHVTHLKMPIAISRTHFLDSFALLRLIFSLI